MLQPKTHARWVPKSDRTVFKRRCGVGGSISGGRWALRTSRGAVISRPPTGHRGAARTGVADLNGYPSPGFRRAEDGIVEPPAGTKVPIEILRAGLPHLDELTELFEAYRRFYREPPEPAAAREFLSERLRRGESVVFLARQVCRAVGFVQLYPTFSSNRLGRIWILNDLFVVPERRGQGIGSRLLGRSKELAEESGALGLILETAVNNPAQRLYEAHGWKLDREFLHYEWQRPVDPRRAT